MPASDTGRTTRPQLEDLAGAPAPAAAYAALAGARELLATATMDQGLATELLALPARERTAAARHEPRYHRPSLVKLLALRAEGELFDPVVDARPVAALGAELATAMDRDPQGLARPTAALAHWLLGKAFLKVAQWRPAHDSFRAMEAFVPAHGPSEEAALASVGRAQLAADTDDVDAAVGHFLQASSLYARLGATGPAAACQAELGLLLAEIGDLSSAATAIRLALELLDPAFAPSLAARLRLGLAEVAATMGDLGEASEQLHRAAALYPLAPSPTEAVARRWAEARVAAAAGERRQAEVLLAPVRRELLDRGSVAEAARVTFEQVLLRIESKRHSAVPELTRPLALAFPGAGEWFAAGFEELARLAAERPEALHAGRVQWKKRLRRAALPSGGRAALLAPSRLLTDRVLRRHAESEDPLGAAAGL